MVDLDPILFVEDIIDLLSNYYVICYVMSERSFYVVARMKCVLGSVLVEFP